MLSRRVRDVMTRQVVTVTEQTPFTEMVRLLAVHKISALPVVTGTGWVVGIVSEADLLRKQEYQLSFDRDDDRPERERQRAWFP